MSLPMPMMHEDHQGMYYGPVYVFFLCPCIALLYSSLSVFLVYLLSFFFWCHFLHLVCLFVFNCLSFFFFFFHGPVFFYLMSVCLHRCFHVFFFFLWYCVSGRTCPYHFVCLCFHPSCLLSFIVFTHFLWFFFIGSFYLYLLRQSSSIFVSLRLHFLIYCPCFHLSGPFQPSISPKHPLLAIVSSSIWCSSVSYFIDLH